MNANALCVGCAVETNHPHAHTSRGDAWRARRLDRIVNHQCAECGAAHNETQPSCTACGARIIRMPEDTPTKWSGELTPEQTIERASHIVARLRLKSLGIATAALLFLSVTSHSACYQAGVTGEGFPVITCPLEGATYYVDLDGTDGSRGTENDGRWIKIS
jgi:DNA-directed RNA polymerase subunit RPC12/RpoP